MHQQASQRQAGRPHHVASAVEALVQSVDRLAAGEGAEVVLQVFGPQQTKGLAALSTSTGQAHGQARVKRNSSARDEPLWETHTQVHGQLFGVLVNSGGFLAEALTCSSTAVLTRAFVSHTHAHATRRKAAAGKAESVQHRKGGGRRELNADT